MRWVTILVLVVALGGVAYADKADLEREIGAQRAAARDLKALDAGHVAGDEVAELEAWLDDAAGRLQAGRVNLVRETLNRCLAQAEMIRQKIEAGKMHARVVERQRDVTATRKRIEELKKAIAAARARKAELEAQKK